MCLWFSWGTMFLFLVCFKFQSDFHQKISLKLTSKTALKLAWGRGKGDGTIPNYLSHCTMAQDLN